MFRHAGGRWSMTYDLKDIDYNSAANEERKKVYDSWEELLNSLDSSKAAMKITLLNRRMNKKTGCSRRFCRLQLEMGMIISGRHITGFDMTTLKETRDLSRINSSRFLRKRKIRKKRKAISAGWSGT